MESSSCSGEEEAKRLLHELRAEGICLGVRNPHGANPSIIARPAKRLGPLIQDQVRERRDWLIELLRREQQGAVLEAKEWLQGVAGRIVCVVPHASDKSARHLDGDVRPVLTEHELLRLRRDAKNGLSDEAVAQVVYLMGQFQGDLLRNDDVVETMLID